MNNKLPYNWHLLIGSVKLVGSGFNNNYFCVYLMANPIINKCICVEAKHTVREYVIDVRRSVEAAALEILGL